jgi:hypothetical protein
MRDELIEIADDFYNVRGSFKVAGVYDVGTQTSLVRLKSGDFVLLDAYTLSDQVEQRVLALTDGGKAVRAILNLHPFHTVHLPHCLRPFPNAKLYGTRRHKARAPSLPWQALETDQEELHALFAGDLEFTVPRGVDLIPKSERVHFASVLTVHRASRTLHVDDTLTWLNLPLVAGLRFHPTLRFALQKRKGAAADFRAWADAFAVLCQGLEHVCTAHGRSLPPQPMPSPSIEQRVRTELTRVEGMLRRHERRYG